MPGGLATHAAPAPAPGGKQGIGRVGDLLHLVAVDLQRERLAVREVAVEGALSDAFLAIALSGASAHRVSSAEAKQKAASTGGIIIDTRARLGYTAPIGSTDQDRIRHLTIALPPIHAARLFDAQEAEASDARLQETAAEALKEVYFQDGGRRAGSLDKVRFTDIEHLEFDL
ncbi:telomere-protecting terminal protein Tpg [Streptomyces cyaneofuscatus]|uniref:telomere-protecting terminal protein Tpg n=1 Tax=Streptomyces cyaneofuscatus TaxID=66883 RepID=UPI0038099F5B